MTQEINNLTKQILEMRSEQIEMYAAAFFKQYGKDIDVNKYILVEQHDYKNGAIKYWLERKEGK